MNGKTQKKKSMHMNKVLSGFFLFFLFIYLFFCFVCVRFPLFFPEIMPPPDTISLLVVSAYLSNRLIKMLRKLKFIKNRNKNKTLKKKQTNKETYMQN